LCGITYTKRRREEEKRRREEKKRKMDRYFCRDFMIFLTYTFAVYWGICIERSVQEIRNQIHMDECNSSVFRETPGLQEKSVPMPPVPVLPVLPMPPVPDPVLPCPITGYRPVSSGEGACIDCPDNSATLASGGTMVQECLCFAGYEGDINSPADTCTQCPADEYNENPGSARCDACPDNSVTLEVGATMIEQCLCAAGYKGIIIYPADVCTPCPANKYSEIGSARCSTRFDERDIRYMIDLGFEKTDASTALDLCGKDVNRAVQHLIIMRNRHGSEPTAPKITEELLKEKVTAMAAAGDFETLSLKIIRERLATDLGQDMGAHKKAIKAVVNEVISAGTRIPESN